MFYTEKPDRALRFGDVLRGYPSTTPRIEEPFLTGNSAKYKIDVALPDFTVIMDPSCEIREQAICLTPLIKVKRRFFDNPYFAKDLTRINQEMEPQEALSPLAWKKLSEQKQLEKLKEGRTYALLNLFIYEKHDLFPLYTVKRKGQEDIMTNYYLIDFRNTYKICCKEIISPEKSPLKSKVLQLSSKARSELTNKLLKYYERIHLEDKPIED